MRSLNARTDAISAALRHVRDAELLADEVQLGRKASLDQAYHLAGFGPECARKACLIERWADQAIGHGFDSTSEGVLNIVLALDPHAHRYRPREWASLYPDLADWTPNVRYVRTGTFDETRVTKLLEAARAAVDNVVQALWADGVLLPEALGGHGVAGS